MKFLLVDDHVLIREALRTVVREVAGDCELHEAASAQEAWNIIEGDPAIGLVFLDLGLPDRDGLSLLADLRREHPAISVVVLSALADRQNVLSALDLGAVGFIPKSANRTIMVSALRLILSGGTYVPPEILVGARAAGMGARQDRPPPLAGLTERQLAVLSLMAQGKSNKVICAALGLAETTVKNHVTAILKALNVTNRTEAVVAVTALGWKLPRPGGGE